MDKKEKWLDEILSVSTVCEEIQPDRSLKCIEKPNPTKKKMVLSPRFMKFLLDGTVEKYLCTFGLIIGNIILLAAVCIVGKLGLNLLSFCNEIMRGWML